MREALSNICRHAEANNVEVSYVYIADSDDTLLTISDDGKGISGNFDHTHHHGLMIMQAVSYTHLTLPTILRV